MRRILSQIKDHILPSTMGISLTKGFDVQDGKLKLMSEMVRDELSIECAALSGANVASQIAEEEFSEATIACRNTTQARLFQQLFHRPYFRIRCTNDVEGVELCGALKNVIAIACGFVDGLGLGSNSKVSHLQAQTYNYTIVDEGHTVLKMKSHDVPTLCRRPSSGLVWTRFEDSPKPYMEALIPRLSLKAVVWQI